MLRIPRWLKVGLSRSFEVGMLRIAGRRRKVDRFNQLIEGDVRETVNVLRSIHAKTIVGIPFYKEVSNLGGLIAKTQADLDARGKGAGIVVVGERKTRNALFEVVLPPSVPGVKVVRFTKPFGFGQKPGLGRRSWSHWAILQVAGRCGADLVFIDADVRNSEGWVNRYLDAIQNRGAKVAVANYVRGFAGDDAIVHVWDSLIFGALFKKWVAFRHGGDYAISRTLVREIFMDQSIMRERTYTMDSAVIARAARTRGRIEAVWLGTKEHELIQPQNLFNRLHDLVGSVFADIALHLPALLRLPREEAVLEIPETAPRSMAIRDLIGADFRGYLYEDLARRFELAAGDIRSTLGSSQFARYAVMTGGVPAEEVEVSPLDWAKSTLRFLSRYIRCRDSVQQAVLANAYVPILELGVLGFLNRTIDLSYESALLCLDREYLPAFRQIWNGLARRLVVYRMAVARRWPTYAFRRLVTALRRLA
jgi:hypothetical protein